VDGHGADGVLLTGVYRSGKSSVAAEIAYLLEQRGEPYALLDLDYLSWAGTGWVSSAGARILRSLGGILGSPADQIQIGYRVGSVM
jgi:hypothetical protein